MKGSFENYMEANSVADYLQWFKDDIDFDDLAIMSTLRTQVLVIKSVIQDVRKKELGAISKFNKIGSFEDFISRRYKTIIVSLVRTKPFAEHGGPLMNSQALIDYLKSRAAPGGKIVIISKEEALNDIWRNAFHSAPGVTFCEQ